MSTVQPHLAFQPRPTQPWLVCALYVAAYLLLDWVSFIRPLQGLNITPWNPQPALAVALLLWNVRLLWLVWLSLVLAELVVRGAPTDWLVMLVATAALSLSFAAIARALTLKLDRSLALATRRDLSWFTAIVIGGALLSGGVYVTPFVLAGIGTGELLLEAIGRYWIGDAVGGMVMLPLLLMLMNPQRRASLARTLRSRQWWLIAALIVVLLWDVFARDSRDHFKFFYLLLLPVVWAAARLGLTGAVLAAGLTQVGLIVALRSVPQDLTVFELQLLLAALTMTGLLLGVAVDERARAVLELKGSLQLMAAGQMSAALAHELSQPLTALSSYAQSARLLLATQAMREDERLARLADVTQRMAHDAERAGAVVKRLREFFRSGSTQLQAVSPASLLRGAIDTQRRRAELLHVRLDDEIDATLPTVSIDPVQIEVVLRNLLANAIDAASATGDGRVVVRAGVDHAHLLVQVHDNGPGIDAARLRTLFEPGHSDKPGGMGLGLSLCRAIVEAHGGRLWAEDGPHGLLRFTLPLDLPEGLPHAS